MLPLEAYLFLLLVALAMLIARMRDLFAAAMLFGIFSLLSAGLFTLMDAVDVAFTEAAVGAGISTVLILGTLAMTRTQERNGPIRLTPLLVCLAVGGTLLWAVTMLGTCTVLSSCARLGTSSAMYSGATCRCSGASGSARCGRSSVP